MSKKKVKSKKLSRREFLLIAGTGGAVLLGVRLGIPLLRTGIATWVEESGGPPASLDAEPTAWFKISADNRVTLYIPKVEMGQGVHTSLAQIAAEELGIPWENLEVKQAGTGQGLDDNFGTSGSSTISSLYQPLREAGALMREMLRIEAAAQLDLPLEGLTPSEGGFIGEDISVTFGEVVANKTTAWEIPDEIPNLKPSKDFKLIGQSLPRVDLLEKILGKAIFGYDLRAEGMLYGAVLRPPTVNGSLKQVVSFEDARALSGVTDVVVRDNFVGVVANTRETAYQAIGLIEAEWDQGQLWETEEIESMVTVGKGNRVVIQDQGNAPRVLEKLENVVTAEYRSPMGYHAHLEPMAALADVRSDGVTVWVSTQTPVRIQSAVAEAIDRKDEEVVVKPTYLGGGFGRKIDESAAVEAAVLSAASGKPVHIGWTREEDFQHGFMRPPVHNKLIGSVDSRGYIQALEHQQASGEVAFPFFPSIAKLFMGADFGSWRGSYLHYMVPDKQTTTWLIDLPIPTGWWRGLGVLPNVFAVESFIDELAHSIGMDPLEFRILNLPISEAGQRIRKVLEEAAKISNWYQREEGVGKGIAWSTDVNTVVAEVAEVRVTDNKIKVEKISAVVDPGLVISPDGARAQTLGAITMGLSAVLKEEVTLSEGKLNKSNFHNYPLLSMKETPDIEIQLISSGEQPFGLGEPPIGPVGAAVANAVFDLTGVRLRNLPLRLEI